MNIPLNLICTIAFLSIVACQEPLTQQDKSNAYSIENQVELVNDNQPSKYIDGDEKTIKQRIRLPESFQRIHPDKNSFGYYLQNFPLKPHDSKVYLHNGSPKYTQAYHLAVLDIDTGKRDLQQCADAVMRLRAEFLYAQERHNDIQFHFTNGFLANYSRWKDGERISVKGNKVNWYKSGPKDRSYPSFRKYMNMIFSYAGTLSLNKELNSKSLKDLNIGDVFIQGGSPGHAVIVVDSAIHESSGEKIFLIAQSYMPAQDIHIIKNNKDMKYGPWYSISEIQNGLTTPEWSFTPRDLKSF